MNLSYSWVRILELNLGRFVLLKLTRHTQLPILRQIASHSCTWMPVRPVLIHVVLVKENSVSTDKFSDRKLKVLWFKSFSLAFLSSYPVPLLISLLFNPIKNCLDNALNVFLKVIELVAPDIEVHPLMIISGIYYSRFRSLFVVSLIKIHNFYLRCVNCTY